MFYLPDGIMQSIYVCPVIHGGVPTVTLFFFFFCGVGGYLQALWRGFSLRRRLKAALAAVPVSDMEEDDFFEEDVFEELDAFFLKQVCRLRHAPDVIGVKMVKSLFLTVESAGWGWGADQTSPWSTAAEGTAPILQHWADGCY